MSVFLRGAAWHSYSCGQTVGWIKMPLGKEVGLGSGHFVLDGDPATHSSPSPLSAHAYCVQTVAHLSNCWALVSHWLWLHVLHITFCISSRFICEVVNSFCHGSVCVWWADHVDDAPRTSGWKIVLGIFLSIVALLCLIGAYVFYQSQTFSRKRFY